MEKSHSMWDWVCPHCNPNNMHLAYYTLNPIVASHVA